MTPQQATALATRLAEIPNHGQWEVGPVEIQFECSHGIWPVGAEGSLCYVTSEERAEWVALQLRRAHELEIGVKVIQTAWSADANRLTKENQTLRALVGRMKEALKEIAKPRLGGKQQQWTAQQALEDAGKVIPSVN